MLITRLLLVLEVWDGKLKYRKSWAVNILVWSDLTFGPSSRSNEDSHEEIMGWQSFGVDGFDLGPLLQGQTRIVKLKSAYNPLIIGRRGLGC